MTIKEKKNELTSTPIERKYLLLYKFIDCHKNVIIGQRNFEHNNLSTYFHFDLADSLSS